ncbi:MAG TPA: hypothetical protein VIK08_05525 [Candidatus Limnocylindrales bacterium]
MKTVVSVARAPPGGCGLGVDVVDVTATNMVAHIATTSAKVDSRAAGAMTYFPHAIVGPAGAGANRSSALG